MKKNKITLPKVLICIFTSIMFILALWYLIQVPFLGYNPNYFMEHFLACICLVCLGIDCLIINNQTKSRIVGENKGDQFMVICGLLMIIAGVLSIFVSYIM